MDGLMVSHVIYLMCPMPKIYSIEEWFNLSAKTMKENESDSHMH